MKDGYELINEALNLLNNVYGAMHPEIAQCLRMLARLNYIMGEHSEAMAYQQKAVLMSERVNGIDHPYTITEYTHLALYCFANSQISMVSTDVSAFSHIFEDMQNIITNHMLTTIPLRGGESVFFYAGVISLITGSETAVPSQVLVAGGAW